MTGPTVVAVVGPTATGKSDLAVWLAQQLNGEIVNADSMQLYTGMDIGTAKLSPEQRADVAHHLLDIWPVTVPAAVARYQRLARECIEEIHARGKVAVLVGGSGLYLRGTLDRLEFPGESEPIRTRLQHELDTTGVFAMHERLRQLDPEAAQAILPTNARRIVRALEVIEITGRPFLARMPDFDYLYPTVQLGLDRDDLDERVELRVQQMMLHGFLEEVRGLLPLGLRDSPTASKALGYAQLLACLDEHGGVVGDVDEAVAITVRATWRFVRRQRSWFRRDPRIHWLDGSSPQLKSDALAAIHAYQ